MFRSCGLELLDRLIVLDLETVSSFPKFKKGRKSGEDLTIFILFVIAI